MKGLFFYLGLSLLLAFKIQAQDSGLRFNRYDLEQGLSSRNVKCILKDSRGFLWVGTEDGLNRFDGREFKTYKYSAKNPNSIAGSNINSIVEDKLKRLWVATPEGLSCFDPVLEKFTNYSTINDGNVNRLSEYSLSVYLDKAGTIWGLGYSGIARYNPARNDFTAFKPQTETPDQKRIYFKTAFEDSHGKFWLGSLNSIFLFDRKTGKSQYYKTPYKSIMTVNEIYEDAYGRLLLGTWDYGLVLFNPIEKSFKSYLFTETTSTSNNIVTSITETFENDKKKYLWLSTSNGLFQLDINNNHKTIDFHSAILYKNDKTNPESLHETGLNLVYNDDQNILWIGGAALSCLNPVRQFVKTINLIESVKHGINKIYEDSAPNGEKIFWTSDWGDGINKFNSHFKKLEIKNLPVTFNLRPDLKNTNEIIKDHSGRIWVATMDGVVSFIEGKTNSQLYFSKNINDSSLSENKAMSIFEDSKNRIWVGNYTRGINIIYDQGKRIYKFDDKRKGNTNYDFKTMSIFEDNENRIWLCTNYGLKLFDENKKDLVNYGLPLYGKQTYIEIYNICEDYKSHYWLATNYGLYEFNFTTGNFNLYNSSNGLCNDNLTNMILTKGKLVLGTINGLSIFDINSKIFNNFYIKDGLQKNEFNLAFTNSKDILYTGDECKINYFNINELIKRSPLPKVIITGLKIFDKDTIFAEAQNNENEITLTYKQNFVSLSFTAPYFISPFQLKYMYKMEGLHNEWIENGDRQIISFANLQPGHYIFHVKTVSNDMVSSGKETLVKLYIRPAFWQTWWFTILVIIALAFSIYLIYRYNLKQALKLERLRTKISTDLHDDIGSTLSSISILSDIILHEENKNTEQSFAFINEIKDSSLSLMDKMGDIVWSIDPKNDSIEKLMLYFNRYASQLFEAKGIEYEIFIEESISKIELPMDWRQHIYLIMKEAINNMVKYSRCTLAKIAIKYSNQIIKIEIQDNGKGFDISSIKTGNGIYNMKERAKLLNSIIQINSIPGTGTTISLSIKIR